MSSGSAAAIVVTGAARGLGRSVVRELLKRGSRVRGLGRGPAPAGLDAPWSRVDLLSGEGLAVALEGADVVIHCASDPSKKNADVAAARSLAEAAQKTGVRRIIYVQIAGIAEAARVSSYYRAKLLAERVLRDGAVPCSVMAATQFYGLINRIFSVIGTGPIMPLPKFTLQPVDVDFFSSLVADEAGRLDPRDVVACGSEMLNSRRMAASWLAARGRHKPIIPVPAVGPFAAFAQINPVEGITGGLTWEAWLGRTQGHANT